MNVHLRERLATVREQLKVLRQQRAEAKRNRDLAKAALESANSPSDVRVTDTPEFIAAEAAQARVQQIDDEIAPLLAAEHDILEVLGRGGGGLPSYSFLANPEVAEDLARRAHSEQPVGDLRLGQFMSADEVAGLFGAGLHGGEGWMSKLDPLGVNAAITDNSTDLREGPYRGIAPQLKRPLSFLDFWPSVTVTEGKSHDYTVESGALTGAAETAEEQLKPELAMQLDDKTVTYQTIAGWVKVARQKLDDSADLGNRIRSRALYSVMLRLETQVIGGNGSGANLLGVLNSGVASAAFVSGSNPIDMIVRCVQAIRAVGAVPNVAAVSLTDLTTAYLMKATGSGEYLFFSAMQLLNSMGVSVVPSIGLTAGTVVVADTRLAGRVIVREGANVRISDSDQDDVIRNKVTILAEGRFGVEVTQPTAVCRGALS